MTPIIVGLKSLLRMVLYGQILAFLYGLLNRLPLILEYCYLPFLITN